MKGGHGSQGRSGSGHLPDGVGFDTSRASADLQDGMFGLIAMRQQVEALGGSFAVPSRAGTRVVARFAGSALDATAPAGVS